MSFSPSDLGELGSLATALGLVDGSGDFREDWLSRPGHYLSNALGNGTQREGLVEFIDEVLGGERREEDAAGRVWLPLFSESNPRVTVFLVLDDSPTTHVRIGLGVELGTTGPDSATRLFVMPFRAAKQGHTVPNPILIGQPGGEIGLTTSITLDAGTPAPGDAHLGGIGIGVLVPTDGSTPAVSVELTRLQMPGTTALRDLSVSVSDVDQLDDAALDLVLGLVRAQVDSPSGPALGALSGLAGMLGLRGTGGVPALPVADLAARGPAAIAEWFEAVIGNATTRTAWLNQVAALLGGGATVTANEVRFTVGPAQIGFGVQVVTGAAGRPVITPVLSATVTSASARARAEVELLRLDLATGAALAVPRLSAFAHLGRVDGTGTRILTGDPGIDAVRVGIALDEQRRPVFLLAADGVTLNGRSYPTLDLSTPDALADAVGTALSDIVADLLTQLGPVGDALSALLGLQPPAGHPAVPTLDFGAFLQDPLAAVRAHWRTLLRDHAVAVPTLLATVRDLLADAGVASAAVAGSGTVADPWRIVIVDPVELLVWSEAGGDRLEIALAATYVVDTLGQRCTRVETRLRIGLASLDLAGGHAVFAPAVEVRVQARARGSTRAMLELGPLELLADHVAFVLTWTPQTGIHATTSAPNLAVRVDDLELALPLPEPAVDGSLSLDAAGWAAVETLFGALGLALPVPWLRDLLRAFDWSLDVDPALAGPRLRLADLEADAETELRRWLGELLLDPDAPVRDALVTVARVLTGSEAALGFLRGAGRPDAPWTVPLLPVPGAPELASWLGPIGPRSIMATGVPAEVRDWRPGTPPLPAALLAETLRGEARAAADVAGLVAGRSDIALGIEALVARWRDTDGRVVPPATDPAGITVHRITDVAARRLGARIDLDTMLGGTPAVTVRVAVVAPGAALPWPAAPANRVIDLRAPGLAPDAFTPPTAAAGEWFIALADRAGARLPTGDADGTAGQAGRLARVLGAFASVGGDLALVAEAEAGHAARLAADAVAAVTSVVTLGTPLGPVAFTILDELPGADALRLLQALIPAADPDETDDPDLGLARDLIDSLIALLPLDDPTSELQPPAAALAEPRAGLAVHAVFGVVTEDAVRRAITAVVAAGLATRAMRRFSLPFPGVDVSRTGIRIPIAAGTAGVTVAGHAVLDLFGAAAVPGGLPTLATDRAVRVHLEIRRAGGWLVGGPDPGRIGPRSDHELRWIEAKVTIPLGDTAPGEAELILHEPRVFGVARDRWIVRADASGVATDEVVTPALPEVRVLVADAISALEGAAADSAPVAAVLELLRGIGVVDDVGGSVPDAIDHLLHDPRVHVRDALADAAKRARMATGLDALLAAVPGLTVDLGARRVALALSGSPGDRGLLDWTLLVEADATGAATAVVTIGTAGASPAGGALLRLTTAPLSVTLEWHRGTAAPDIIRLWPAPDADAALRAVGRLLPAELLRFALESLRGLDPTAKAILDAALDAAGLLADAAADGARAVRLPAALLEDPAAWFRHPAALGGAGGFSPAKVAALLDAAKPILGVAGAPGEWQLANGVRVFALADGADLRLSAALDTTGFTSPAVAARLAGTLTAGLLVRATGSPLPSLSLALGIPGAAPGRRAVHVALNGDLRVFLRPETGPDLPLFPDPPGLGQLADVAVTQALPLVLDELAAQTGAGLSGQVGAVVREVGDALALRSGSPARFDGAALQAWATDPAAALAARLPALTASALNALATALDAALPAPASASVVGGEIRVVIGGVTVALATAPFAFRLTGAVTGIPGVERISLDVTLDATGLRALVTELGPAPIDAGGVMLRPFIGAAVGSTPTGGRRIEFGLGLDAAGTRAVGGRWNLDAGSFTLFTRNGAIVGTDPEQIALGLLDAVLDLVASFALSTNAMQDFLNTTIPGSSQRIRDLLRGVLLEDAANPTALDNDLFEHTRLLGRLQRLLGNFAAASPSINIGGGLSLGMAKTSGLIELTLGVNGRIEVVSGDVYVAIEADSRWIEGTPDAGLALGVLRETSPNSFTFEPGIAVNGVGLRIGRSNGPLLDFGVTLGSVALHGFGRVNASEKSGGVQLQLSELAVGVGSAEGGNPIAQGMLADASAGNEAPSPAFSPALAVQKHGAGDVKVSLRAGDGDGPWWLAIQKGFGPLYIEQVGFGVTVREDDLERISLLLDGRISIFGLTAAVDDLQLTFVVASDASPFDPSRWAVDLAGLAISADMGGVVLAGGLRKFSDATSVEYIGMLVARFATYGLSVFGGYGEGLDESGQKFAAFFAFGAIVGPIGGPPAFFLTGIGGGLGINRGLVFPTDMSRFGEFVFLKALDPAASPSDDPMEEMRLVRQAFPMRRGEFWFAAGISFNSFALVDGIAVLAVAIGDDLEITLLGLARMALPRPEIALVSIELGLIVRFSTKEGVLWIQAQLTDNSWLLHESVRLTGGFAFVTWYKGPYAGQFVLTLGGYHPSFHREGYPIVPRLGFNWSVSSAITIKGENYFALTSEAVMAGGRLEASAKFGPAWASLVLGADGIVYFDPFRFSVEVYARISAGVTINVLIGRITIKISLGARILLEGPQFRGKATFEVGPIELTVKFGSWTDGPREYLAWDAFTEKYLEVAAPGRARVITALPGDGQVPPGTGPGGNTDTATADGSQARPFEVLSEFELTITTTVPQRKLKIGTSAEQTHSTSQALGLAPMNRSTITPRLELHLRDDQGDHLSKLTVEVMRGGGFPVGVWGRPQDDDDRKVPKGDVIDAVDSLRFEAVAAFEGTLPPEIPYHQIETGPRQPLPFVHEGQARPLLLQDAHKVQILLPNAANDAAMYAVAQPWLAQGGYGRTALAALEKDRTAPPRLGSLAEGLANTMPRRGAIRTPKPTGRPTVDHTIHPAEFIGVLSSEVLLERTRLRTTVSQAERFTRVRPPTLADVRTGVDTAVAMSLTLVGPTAGPSGKTLSAGADVPLTRAAHGGTAAVAARGMPGTARTRLNELNSGLFRGNSAGPLRAAGAAARAPGATPAVRPGEVAVLRMPNAARDTGEVARRPRLLVTGGAARIVVLAAGGRVLWDAPPLRNGVTLDEGADRIAVLALGDGDPAAGGLSGWHAGQELAYVGWSSAVAPGAIVQVEGRSRLRRRRQRFRTGWTPAAELVADATIVTTRFAHAVSTVVVALDDPGALDDGSFIALDLTGADRPTGRNGEPIPPALVVSGNRSFLVYAVVPHGKGEAVTVGIARESGWKLAGVLGAEDTVSSVVDRLARLGLDAIVRPYATGRHGELDIRWSGAVPPGALRARAARDRVKAGKAGKAGKSG